MAEAQVMENRSVVIEENPEECFQESNVRLRLKKPKSKKKVIWREDTVDNEHMNKKKSKCCCIYEKPRAFGESSSESEDECENCRGHVENRNKKLMNSESSGMRVLPPEISPAL